MLPRILVAWLALLLLSGCAHRPRRPLDDPTAQAAAFERDTGVALRLVGQPGAPPPAAGPRVVHGPVEPEVVVRFLPVMREVLHQYPEDFRAEVVPEIVLVGALRMRGRPFLGAAHPRQGRLVVALRPRLDEARLTGTLHHEIAHLVQRHPAFDAARWRAFSAGSHVGRDPATKWPDRGRPWLRHGFVTRYASKDPAEDFAELCELAFTRPAHVRRLAARHPAIGRKLAFATETWRRLAPGMVLPWVDGEPAADGEGR